jgi:hypothetical protein
MTFTAAYKGGAIPIKRSVIALENMPEMRMAMAFVKFMSIQWKDFGLCYALG